MVFFNDLKEGQKIEDEMIMIFSNKDSNVIKAPNKQFYDYDFIIDDIKYECKYDKLASKTGNICIEFECNSKPSGISTTQSKYYIIKTNDNIYKIKVKKIKKIIDNNNFKIVNGGDGYRSKMYLIDKSYFEKYIYKI
jgi:hypothetical protein